MYHPFKLSCHLVVTRTLSASTFFKVLTIDKHNNVMKLSILAGHRQTNLPSVQTLVRGLLQESEGHCSEEQLSSFKNWSKAVWRGPIHPLTQHLFLNDQWTVLYLGSQESPSSTAGPSLESSPDRYTHPHLVATHSNSNS